MRRLRTGPASVGLLATLLLSGCSFVFEETGGGGGGSSDPLRIFGSPTASHYCLARGKKFLCWGNNDFGQLGLGHDQHIGDDERADQVLVPIEMPDFITDIVMSEGHTCVATSALEMYCFGRGDRGALGYGDAQHRQEPITEAGHVRVDGAVRELGADLNTTCVLRDGEVLCWGQGDQSVHCALYEDCTGPDIGTENLPEELESVPLAEPVESLFVGRGSACAMLQSGAIQCWGDNFAGQHGDGTESGVTIGLPTAATHQFETLAVGSGFVCGLDAQRNVRCWGLGEDGQMGLASTANLSFADEARSVGFERPVQRLVAGDEHVCVKFQGSRSMQCWGQGQYGALGRASGDSLGDDERVGILEPLPLEDVVDIAAGRDSTCAILTTDEVVCWGLQSSLSQDNVGALGTGQQCSDIGNDALGHCAYGNDPSEPLSEAPRLRFDI